MANPITFDKPDLWLRRTDIECVREVAAQFDLTEQELHVLIQRVDRATRDKPGFRIHVYYAANHIGAKMMAEKGAQ